MQLEYAVATFSINQFTKKGVVVFTQFVYSKLFLGLEIENLSIDGIELVFWGSNPYPVCEDIKQNLITEDASTIHFIGKIKCLTSVSKVKIIYILIMVLVHFLDGKKVVRQHNIQVRLISFQKLDQKDHLKI